MSELISGKEALIALASGKEVEYWCETDPSIQKRWTLIKNHNEYKLSYFLEDKPRFEFRLKPVTILINGIEVPACGENYIPNSYMYVLNSLDTNEYSRVILDEMDEVPAYWWRTEEEIKQVVEALRSIFNK